MDSYQLLINKLDEFIRKYYKNQVLRGLIYSLAFFLVAFLLFNTVEYYGHFSTTVRTVLFYSFILINGFIVIYWFGLPLIRLFRLGAVISHDQAAKVIGQHFPDVQDKLLNTLQLKRMADQQPSLAQQEIIQASINQRIGELKPVPFTRAIDLGENKKYLKYALGPLILLIIISFVSPHVVFNSTERLLKHRTYYEEKAPFQFNLENDTLRAVRQENYTVKVSIDGDELPKEVYVHAGDNRYRMNKQGPSDHQYTLKKLQDNFQLQFEANGFYSDPYQVKVLPKPVLKSYEIKLDYPQYTGKTDKVKENIGDINVPEGTEISWQFKTDNTEKVKMVFNDTAYNPARDANNEFSFKRRFYDNQRYYVKPVNEYMESRDSTLHYVSVVPDAYPQVKVKKESDSLTKKRQFFSGEVSDDYGISRLAFHYEYVSSKDTAKTNQGVNTEFLDVNEGESLLSFYHSWNLNKLSIEPGDEIEYYFEVWDNDAVNGEKSTRSKTFTFHAPTEEELEEEMEKNQQEIEEQLKEAARQSQKLRESLEKAREKLLNKDNLSWEDKQFIKKTLEKQKELQKQKEQLQKQYQQSLQKQNEYNQLDKSMKKDYERMNKLMENNMSEEMKEMMKEIQKMLDNDQKESVEEKMKEMSRENKSNQKQLERSLDLYKKLALEQKMKSTSKKLDNLSEEQKELSKKTKNQEAKKGEQSDKGKKKADKKEKEKSEEKGDSGKKGDKDGKKDPESGKEKEGANKPSGDEKQGKKDQPKTPEGEQKEIKKDFESVQEDLKEMEKLSKELENSPELQQEQENSKEIQKLLEESLNKLRKQDNQGASKKQKKASEKMEKMAKKMKEKMSQMDQESMMLNYQRVRKILENLIHLSNEQEDLMEQFKEVENYNPQFVDLAQKQSQLKEDAEMIEDSLQSLSKKVMMIKKTVNEEIEEINYQMEKTREFLSNRKIGKVRNSQQYIMTATNNLAVLLSDLMNQMQQQMSSSMKGSQMCNNPMPGKMGKKKPGKKGKKKSGKMGEIKKMQEKLGEKMGEMKKGKQGSRQGANSKDLAKLAKRQEQLRQKLRELKKEQEESGKDISDELDEIQKMMKENEKDIINNDISGETMQRQQEINVKMLEAKKAQRTQGRDKKRESQTADDMFRKNPPSLEEYQEKRENQIELLQTVPPTLNGYYRMKVQDYFKSIQ